LGHRVGVGRDGLGDKAAFARHGNGAAAGAVGNSGRRWEHATLQQVLVLASILCVDDITVKVKPANGDERRRVWNSHKEW
jgi:hypothetical protein